MSESTRLKNEAIERARTEGRLEPIPRTEPGASLANAPDIYQAYAQANMAEQPLPPSTPARDTSRASAAQSIDPVTPLTARNISQLQQRAADPNVAAYLARLQSAVNNHQQDQGRTPAREQAPPTMTTEQAMADASQKQDAIRQQYGIAPQNSQMIQNQAPAPRPVNRSPEAKAVDAQLFNKDWDNEKTRADDYQARMLEAVKKAAADNAQDQTPGQSQQQGMSR